MDAIKTITLKTISNFVWKLRAIGKFLSFANNKVKKKVKHSLSFSCIIAYNLYNVHWTPFQYFWHINSNFNMNSTTFLFVQRCRACKIPWIKRELFTSMVRITTRTKTLCLWCGMVLVSSIEITLIGLVNKAFTTEMYRVNFL